jgi:hypothetical protein
VALILVTTPGATDANAYCDLAYVATVVDEMFPVPTAWTAIADDEKARCLVTIRQAIDREALAGDRATTTQACAFPRVLAPTVDERSFEDSTIIPDRVKRANAIGAIELAKYADKSDPFGPAKHAGVSSISLGSEFSANFESGQSSVSPMARFWATTIRPILGNLVHVPQRRWVRG